MFDQKRTCIQYIKCLDHRPVKWLLEELEIFAQYEKFIDFPQLVVKLLSANMREKVYFKSQILVHEYWTILDHFCVPVL